MKLPSGRNPWLSIWTSPRATVREILDTDPAYMVLPLTALAGFFESLGRASWKNLGDHVSLPLILLFCAIGGPLGGLLGLYVGSAVLSWTGSWIDGLASPRQIRAAMAWSSVPFICAGILYLPQLVLVGKGLFISQRPAIEVGSIKFAILGLSILQMIAGIWSFVVFWICLGETQRFSTWKALVNVLLIIVLAIVFILILGMVAAVLGSILFGKAR